MSTLKIPKIVKRSVEAQAADVLRESIMSGALAPGARITEIQISEQLDLSRATVRAALHQLAKEGLTTLVPYTGWTVVSLSPKDVWELYTLRSSTERLAAQLVAATMDAEKSKRLQRSFDALKAACEASDQRRIAQADFAVHREIIALADHKRLEDQYGVIEQQIRIYIRSSDALIDDAETIREQHRAILAPILAGDAEEAGRVSEAHNLTEGRKLVAHLMSGESAEPKDEIFNPSTGRLKNLKTRKREAA
jgi:DNA-binding GntR family transcriptional regulator